MTYSIIRYYQDSSHPDNKKIIKTGLSLEEAKEHCSSDDTSVKNIWFDGFIKEDN